MKRTTLFAKFPQINTAFDWNTVQISHVLSITNRYFALKPADAHHFRDRKRGDTQPTNCHHCSLQKGESNKRSWSEAVMSVATWPVLRTRSMSLQPSMVIEVCTCIWQLARTVVSMDSPMWTWIRADLDSENHQLHCWQSLNSHCSSVVIDRMNAHRSAINEPVGKRANCLQAIRYLTRCHWNYCGTTRVTHRFSRLKVVILSRSTVRKGVATVGNHSHAQINAVTVKIRSPFYPGGNNAAPTINRWCTGCNVSILLILSLSHFCKEIWTSNMG